MSQQKDSWTVNDIFVSQEFDRNHGWDGIYEERKGKSIKSVWKKLLTMRKAFF